MRIAVIIHEYTTRGIDGPETCREIVGAVVPIIPQEEECGFEERVQAEVATLRRREISGYGITRREFEGTLTVEYTEVLGGC